MTATLIEEPAIRHRDDLAGTAALVRFVLRRDRVRLSAWLGAIGLIALYMCTVLPEVAGTPEGLEDTVARWGSPAGRMLLGPGHGFDDPSLESITANGWGMPLMTLAALMSIFLAVRHTRAEEESGRAELMRAAVVGRRAPLTATLIVTATANGLTALLVALIMMGVGGYGAGGSLLLAASVGAVGLAFAGVATVAAQLSTHSRAASGLAGTVFGAAFVVRAAGDVAREGGHTLSWFSPLAWAQQTAPFVKDRWWPLVPLAAVAVVAPLAADALSSRRDLGAGLLATRPGPPRASRWLGTPIGLAFRLQRTNILGWTVALALTGLINSVFADTIGDSDDVPDYFTDVLGEGDLVDGYVGFVATFTAYLMSIFAITAVKAMWTDEAGGRGEPLLATPVGRSAWLRANLLVTGAALVAMAAIIGTLSGLGAAIATGDGGYVGGLIAAQLNLLPAVAVILAAAVALLGAMPRATTAAWGIVAFAIFAGTFAQALDLPQMVLNLSPFEHPAQIPLDAFAATPVIVLSAMAAIGAAVGFVSFRLRDIHSN